MDIIRQQLAQSQEN